MVTRILNAGAGLVVLGLLLAPLGLVAQVAQIEGYDPMLQISHQFAHPNVLLVVDLSASMQCDLQASSWPAGQDAIFGTTDKRTCFEGVSTGVRTGKYTNPDGTWMQHPVSAEDFVTGDWTLEATDGKGSVPSCTDPPTGLGTMKYRWRWHDPSRMAVLKNILGNSIDLTILDQMLTSHQPTAWNALAATIAAKPVSLQTKPMASHHLVASSSTMVNWGMLVFSCVNCHSKFLGNYYNESVASDPKPGCTPSSNNLVNDGCVFRDIAAATAKVVVPINPNDSDTTGQNTIRQQIEAYLAPTTTSTVVGGSTISGLETYTATPTPCALKCANYYFNNTLIPADPVSPSCGRRNFTLLITDGQSADVDNDHNIKSCGGILPWQASGTLYTTTKSATRDGVRTFVVGLSTQVASGTARDELNQVAFYGKTDQTQPQGGVNLPSTDPNWTTWDPGKNYAYFAVNADALANTLSEIIGYMAAGDYTTSAPVASSALKTGELAILASSEFPKWQGHIYAFDITKTSGTAGYLKWDAGWNLTKSKLPANDTAIPWVEGAFENPAYTPPSKRNLYTWDSANKMVPLTTDNLGLLDPICGSCGLTANTIDFIRGYDALTSTVRPWVLGSTINSSPAITQQPERFLQATLESHKAFENKNGSPGNRTALVWVGADDGMLHAFQLSDGKESFAILPPNLLAKQVQLYKNYLANPAKFPTGQLVMPSDHIYGFGGSPRFGDMFDGSAYKTVMITTEGPGGNLIAGLDVTDPVKNVAGGVDPVKVLWSKQGGTDWPSLFMTWSTPAAGASKAASSLWTGIVGAGFNPASTATAQVTPTAMIFNPLTGALSRTLSPPTGTVSSPAAYVGNQTFADSTIYSMSADQFHGDNIVNLALQPDLNGRIWFIPGPAFSSASVGIDATVKISADGTSQQQPIYYACAVNGYTNGASTYDIYTFGSGTVYERSDKVTGTKVGQAGYFMPCLYLVIKAQNTSQATNTEIARIPIQNLYVPEVDASGNSLCPLVANQESVGPWKQTLCKGQIHKKVGLRSQLTAPSSLLVPAPGATGDPLALFLIYDPDAASSCTGSSYIVKISFNVSAGAPVVTETVVYGAGTGAASGFAVANNTVIIAKSAVGTGTRARVETVPNLVLTPWSGPANLVPLWWRELK